MTLRRRCRNGACRRWSVAATECPHCGEPYGPLALGLDVETKASAEMERVRQADTERAYRDRMEEGRRNDIARLVAGIDESDP